MRPVGTRPLNTQPIAVATTPITSRPGSWLRERWRNNAAPSSSAWFDLGSCSLNGFGTGNELSTRGRKPDHVTLCCSSGSTVPWGINPGSAMTKRVFKQCNMGSACAEAERCHPASICQPLHGTHQERERPSNCPSCCTGEMPSPASPWPMRHAAILSSCAVASQG